MSERSTVQEPLLKYADEIGWTRVPRSEAMRMRGGDTAARYFSDVLQAQLLKLNKGIIDDFLRNTLTISGTNTKGKRYAVCSIKR